MITLVFTTKNSILCFVCGLSYERAIFWHKVFGWVTVGAGWIHYVSSSSCPDGWTLLGSLCGMMVFSFWPIRIYLYSIFMHLHWIGIIAVAVGAIWHGVLFGIIGLGYWAFDFFIK